MNALREIWEEVKINLDVEHEVVKLICKKVVAKREKSISKVTSDVMQQLKERSSQQVAALMASVGRNSGPSTSYFRERINQSLD